MSRLTLSLPLYSIIPVSIGILMLWGFFTIFNALRFLQCSPWAAFRSPPENTQALLGTHQDRLFVQTVDEAIYCLQQNRWIKCNLPPFSISADIAPSWLVYRFQSVLKKEAVMQLIRSGGPSQVAYFALLRDGQVYACSTTFTSEVEKIFLSRSIIWLVLPIAAVIWSVAAFLNIFAKDGSPTFWDFWGRGTRIK